MGYEFPQETAGQLGKIHWAKKSNYIAQSLQTETKH